MFWGVVVVLLSAHMSATILGETRLILVAAPVAIVAFAYELPSGAPSDWHRVTVVLHVLAAAFAWMVESLSVYLAAFAVTPLITVWIDIARARGLVCYDSTTSYFLLSRSVAYAVTRTLLHVVVRTAALPESVDYLAIATLSLVESGLMFAYRSTAYSFDYWSSQFATYVCLKTTVFLSLPLLEQFVRRGV